MPDGTVLRNKRVAVYESAAASCPRCGNHIQLTIGEGDVLFTCLHRKDGGGSCGQKVAIVGFPDRVCLVVQLSVQEFAGLMAQQPGSHHVLRYLGLLGVALVPAR